MSSVICFNLEQSKILSSSNGLNQNFVISGVYFWQIYREVKIQDQTTRSM